MSRLIVVFYEDQATQMKEFGPHNLLCACVADTLESDVWAIKQRTNAIDCKGDSKMLARCKAEGARYGSKLALFDADKFPRLLKLPADAVCVDLKVSWTTCCPDWPTRQVILLDQNIESIVALAADLLDKDEPPKGHLQRDALLNQLAYHSGSSSRAQLCEQNASWKLLVTRLVRMLS